MKICDWCQGEGEILGHEYMNTYIIGCKECHHEWSEVMKYEDALDEFKKKQKEDLEAFEKLLERLKRDDN